jgi:hypothetical protein
MPYVFIAVLVLVLGILAILGPRALSADRPNRTSVHAMCYKPAAPKETLDFVCPKDGTRTKYPLAGSLAARVADLPQMQAIVRRLARPEVAARATIELDLSEFCHTCTPEPPASPEAVLSVKVPDGKETRTRGVTADDLVLLEEFFAGKALHRSSDGKTAPLKESLPRIRELLGMPDATIAKPRK